MWQPGVEIKTVIPDVSISRSAVLENFIYMLRETDQRIEVIEPSGISSHLNGISEANEPMSNLFHILIIQSLTTFSTVVSITPGNLGVKEGIIGSFAFMLNIPATDAIFAATVDRGISMVVTFALGLIFSKILMKKYSADSSLAPKS